MTVSDEIVDTAPGGSGDPRGNSRLTQVRPPVYRGNPYIRIAVVMGLIVLWRSTITEGLAGANLINTWLYYSIVVVGFYFVFGLSGQFAFSQAAFAGLGGYVSAWATRNDQPFVVGFLTAVLVTAVLATVFSLLLRRAAHFYFAIATLGLSEILLIVFRTWREFTGSSGGEIVNIKPISLFGYSFDTDYRAFWVLVGFLTVVLVLGALLERSPVRREAIANRDQEVVSSTQGLPVLRLRVSMFVLGSVIAGAAGSVFVHWKGSSQVDSFGVELGLGIFLMLILGGIGSIWGGLLGAWFYVYVQDWLRRVDWVIFDQKVNEMWPIVYGTLLVVVMIVLPDGLIGLVDRFRGVARRGHGKVPMPGWFAMWLGVKAPEPPGGAPERTVVSGAPTPPPDPDAPPVDRSHGVPVLEAVELCVNFGGVRAVDGVSLTVHEGEILGLIGPNGSGKSTFLNAVTGVVPATGRLKIQDRPDKGELPRLIALAAFCIIPAFVLMPLWVGVLGTIVAVAVIGAPRIGGDHGPLGHPDRVRRAGILRTYQTPRTYLQLTCIENVLLATSDRRDTGMFATWVLRPLMLRRERQRWERAAEALDRYGLLDRAEDSAANLSYGQQRLLELARVVAAEPSVLLLDEPSAGLNAAETSVLSRHLARLRDEGVSLLLVDHKIDFISGLCDRVAVLELGQKVAEGDPVGIWTDQRVVDAYLGVTED